MGGGGGKEGDKLPVPQRAFSAAARRPGPASDPTRWVSPFLTRLQEGIFASGFFLGVPRRNLPSAGYRPSIGRTAKKNYATGIKFQEGNKEATQQQHSRQRCAEQRGRRTTSCWTTSSNNAVQTVHLERLQKAGVRWNCRRLATFRVFTPNGPSRRMISPTTRFRRAVGQTLEITVIWDEAQWATFAKLSNGIAESRESDSRSKSSSAVPRCLPRTPPPKGRLRWLSRKRRRSW